MFIVLIGGLIVKSEVSEDRFLDLLDELDDWLVTLLLEDSVAKQIKYETNVTEIIDDHIAGKTFLTISA